MAEDADLETQDVDTEVDSEVQEAPKKQVRVKTKAKASPKTTQVEVEDDEDDDNEWSKERETLKAESIKRRIENRELKKRVEEYERAEAERNDQVSAMKAEFDEYKQKATDRIVRNTLSSALAKSQCVDVDLALDTLRKDVKFDKHGDIANTDELVENLKKHKPYFFGSMSTTQTQPAPRPGPATTKRAQEMTNEEWMAARRNVGRILG